MSNGSYKYQVFFTPLISSDSNTYGPEIDVSDRIELDGIGSISKSIDAGDYDVGVFTFNEINIKGFNYNGYFNDENDSRSIFKSTRDRCKVRVVFNKNTPIRNTEGTVLSDNEETAITFRGIINEEATRLDIVAEQIAFKVLSRDSVLRTTSVQAGVINDLDLTSVAMFKILNQPKITSVLSVSQININPPLDFQIDVAVELEKKSVRDALNELLLATNSVLLLDDAGVVTIRDRFQNTTVPALSLFGKSDQQGRENIVDISNYNTGKQRTFTSFKVNGTQKQNNQFVSAIGFSQKSVTFKWITDGTKEADVALTLVDEFKFPKIELSVSVSTDLARNVKLLDTVSINYPLRVKPIAGKFLPVVGDTVIGDPEMPLPMVFGAIEIKPRVAFKVIEIGEQPGDFLTKLKLRQTGKGYEDGYFDQPGSCLVGFALLGDSMICGTGSASYNPSVIGAARVGVTEVVI